MLQVTAWKKDNGNELKGYWDELKWWKGERNSFLRELPRQGNRNVKVFYKSG